MAISTKSKDDRNEYNITIQNAFSAMRKKMTDSEGEAEKTAEWKSVQNENINDSDKTEES